MEEYSKGAFARTAMLIGAEGVKRLQASHVAVVGLGGVGGHCAEALARSGIGRLTLVDRDVVEQSNLNRQLVATKQTIGMPKAEALALRLRDVSDCLVSPICAFVLPDTIEDILRPPFDFLVDAVDNVTAKLALAQWAQAHGIPMIASMGTGNRLDPSKLYITDIYKTENCHLARAVRKGCRERGIASLPVVCSSEPPLSPAHPDGQSARTPGSMPFVPGAAGLLLASYTVRHLLRNVTI